MDTAIYSNDNDTIRSIVRIDFDIWGNEQIKKASALGDTAGTDIPDLYENSEPKKGGLIDARLGVIGNGIDSECVTCGLNSTGCVGHFGHIDLAEHVLHTGYAVFVHKYLTCICTRCSSILIHKTEEEIKEITKTKTGKELLTYMKLLTRNISHCHKCGSIVPKIKMEYTKMPSTISIIAEIEMEGDKDENGGESKKKLRQTYTPEMIYHILKNISDEDCVLLGMDPKRSRPEDMIHHIFPVPPVSMRPSSKGDISGNSDREDDLTQYLANIVKANLKIIKNTENQNDTTSKYNSNVEHARLLQYYIATYFDNTASFLQKTEQKGKVYKSLSERLKGKEGRIRNNLMGKRTDFTGRSVITTDPNLNYNELGMPIKVAMNLTFPEYVTQYNIEYLTQLVKNGTDVYPGANIVFPASKVVHGKKVMPIYLKYRKDIELHYGDIVERHLKDGDIVIINRQPTLHKQSMMGHKIKVINDPNLLTFRISVAVTGPYNADFDGDEMNIILAQSVQTQIELEEIAGVERQIITPTFSTTSIGIVQDGLLGAYNLTSPTVRIDWRSAMNIISYTTLDSFTSFKKKDYTGHEMFSLIIPPNVTIENSDLKINKGNFTEGRLTNKYLGAKKKNNIIQLIWDGYGITETNNFINNTQKLINNFNLYNGFSVGIGDASITQDIIDQINNIYNTKELKIEHMITEIENNPDIMPQDVFEGKLFSENQTVLNDISKLVIDSLDPDNNFNIMISSGSKGKPDNMALMCGGLGMQAFEGRMVPKKYNKRTLAYFTQNDDRGPSRGLVRSSYMNGMKFPEFVFHMLASRLGVIEQVLKSVTGDTPIVIIENGVSKYVKIGDWIDEHMLNNPNVTHEDNKNMEYLELKHDVYIPTSNNRGSTSWGQMTGITRHEPTDVIYEFVTVGGRTIRAANSKTLLVWNHKIKEFEPTMSELVKVSDNIPVICSLYDSVNMGTDEFDNFDLTYEFGKLVGSYMKYGNNHVKQDENVANFVKQYVPHGLYHTPLEFIQGMMDGIFSDNGLIVGTYDYVNSMCLLLAKARKYCQINHIYGEIYGLNIVESGKFDGQLDVAFDKILSIKKLDSSQYKKLYDVTVPSTLNFALGNGIVCLDTSDTGYAQRKLIKSMEDIMVKYDCTVRTANDTLLQIVYGNSGADTTKQYEYIIRMIDMNNNQVEMEHIFTDAELKDYKHFSKKDNDALYDDLLNMRDKIRISVRNALHDYITITSNYMLPINLKRIINMVESHDDTKKKEYIEPNYIIDRIENLLSNKESALLCMKESDKTNKSSLKHRDEYAHKLVFRLAMYDALSPKRVLKHYKFTKQQFDSIINDVASAFSKNIVEPGEMVGIIAAQSMGEPLTQFTLNSVDWNEKILIRNKKTSITSCVKIGQFIDMLMIKEASKVVEMGDNLEEEKGDVQYLNIEEEDYYVPSVDEFGVMSFEKIEGVSKHLPNNSDGTHTLIKATTSTGRTVTATKGLSFLTLDCGKIVPIRGDKLQKGTLIPITKDFPSDIEYDEKYDEYALDKTFGMMLGMYLNNGYSDENKVVFHMEENDKNKKAIEYFAKQYGIKCKINKSDTMYQYTKLFDVIMYSPKFASFVIDQCGYVTLKKMMPAFAYTANNDFVEGMIEGIFENSLCVKKTEIMVTGTFASKMLVDGISLLMSRKGIITNLRVGYINGVIVYSTSYDLNVTYTENENVLFDIIDTLEEVESSHQYVYDLTVAKTHNFMTYAGINMFDSFHHSGIASVSATTQGVPRMKELFSASKNLKTPSMIIYLDEEYRQSIELSHKIASHVKYASLGDIRGRINVYYDPLPKDKNGIMEQDNVKHVFYGHSQIANKNSCQEDISGLPWLIRIEIDKDKMLDKEITLLDIKSKFCSWWEKRYIDIKTMKKEEKKIFNKITQIAVLSNSDNDRQPVVHIRFSVKDGDRDMKDGKDKNHFGLETINDFIDHIIDKFKLKGIDSIVDVPVIDKRRNIVFDLETGDYDKKQEEYVIFTTGVNLIDIRYLIGVDVLKTITNDVVEAFNVFGIEVARSTLLKEVIGVYKNAGESVNYQHLTLIVDLMTSSGNITSIDRHGMGKTDTDPLSRASFEKSVEQLLTASVFGESEHMKSISSRIMAGAVIKGGTGFCDVVLDTDAIEKSEFNEDSGFAKKYIDVATSSLAKDIKNQNKKSGFFMPS